MNVNPLLIKRILTGATALGALLPWVNFGPVVIAGTSVVEGKLALLAGLLGLFVTFSPPADPRARTFDAVLAGAALLGSGWFWFDNFGRAHFGILSPGYGLFLCIVASIGWSGWIAWDYRQATARGRRTRGPRDWR